MDPLDLVDADFVNAVMRVAEAGGPGRYDVTLKDRTVTHVRKVSKVDEGPRHEDFELKRNCITNDPCVLCGARCNPVGLDVMFRCSLVCDYCVHEYAPDLLAERDQRHAAEHLDARPEDLF